MSDKAAGGMVSGGQLDTFVDPYATCGVIHLSQHPAVVTREARIAAQAIRDAASAMPVYVPKGEPAQYDGDDVRDYLRDYADSLVTPVKARSRRPPNRTA